MSATTPGVEQLRRAVQGLEAIVAQLENERPLPRPCTDDELLDICRAIEDERKRMYGKARRMLAIVPATKGPRGTFDAVRNFGRPDMRTQLRVVK